jgi:hypothetical protein
MEGKIKGVRICKVLEISDDTDADRVKVRLLPEDSNKTQAELDYAFPLLPKMFHVKPKVGEAVLILLSNTNDGNSQRYYIGPIISQDHRLFFDPFFMLIVNSHKVFTHFLLKKLRISNKSSTFAPLIL